MKQNELIFTKKRLKHAYFSTLTSITLVLLMLGLLGVILIYAKNISNYVKESLGFTITIKEKYKEEDIFILQKNIEKKPYTNTTTYISKENAAITLQKELGEDFIDFLGYNPLPATIEITVNAAYANNDSIQQIINSLKKDKIIDSIDYQEPLVTAINNNIYTISIVLMGFSAILICISFMLIKNTIRLSIYSKRFLIKTMELIGATQGFIRKPFLIKGLIYGLVGAVFASTILAVIMIYIHITIPESLLIIPDIKSYLILSVALMFLGIFISFLSTYFSVRKYLGADNSTLYL